MSGLAPLRERPAPRRRRRLLAALAAVAVAAGITAGGVETAAAQGTGTIAGIVWLPGGSAAADATVALEPVDGSGAVEGQTDQNGEYFLSAPAGDYRVRFSTGAFSSYAYGQLSAEDARVFTVEPDQILTVNDTVLARAEGSISGVVRDAAGRGIEGVCVRPYPAEYGNDEIDPRVCTEPDRDGVLTGADGSFTVPGLAQGDYGLDVADPAGRYQRATVARVAVADGEDVTGVTVTLARAGSISGVAVDGRTGAPLADVCPLTYVGRKDKVFPIGQFTCSGADGRWSVSGLAPARYTVLLMPDGALARRFVGGGGKVESARLVKVTAGRDAQVGTVPLFPGATVTGRVTDTAGAPVAGAWVNIGVFNAAAGPGEGQFTARTDEDGRYTIRNVPQMREIAQVYVEGQPYAWQWSGGATDPVRARPLVLRYERTTTYDVVLQPEATLTVQVQGLAEGQALDLRAVSGSGVAEIGFGGYTEQDGTVVLRNLPGGTVTVKGIRSPEPPLTFWYDRATSPGAATKVAVAAGKQTTITMTVPRS